LQKINPLTIGDGVLIMALQIRGSNMVKILMSDLLKSKAQTLVNTVNCVGIMGKGIALKFKEQFPDMFNDYIERCNRKEVRLGKPYVYKRLTAPWILNFPTKAPVSRLHYSQVSSIKKLLKKQVQEFGV